MASDAAESESVKSGELEARAWTQLAVALWELVSNALP